MNYHATKLSEVNPELSDKLRRYCYDIIGFCQTVHKEMGPFLNEYMYQDALEILFKEHDVSHTREYYFSVDFHGQRIQHKHYVDFLVKDKVLVECKAIEALGSEQRQQLWNYMRLTKLRIGILYNFAPILDQCERYYLDVDTGQMFMF